MLVLELDLVVCVCGGGTNKPDMVPVLKEFAGWWGRQTPNQPADEALSPSEHLTGAEQLLLVSSHLILLKSPWTILSSPSLMRVGTEGLGDLARTTQSLSAEGSEW